jgi:hypothetical protein
VELLFRDMIKISAVVAIALLAGCAGSGGPQYQTVAQASLTPKQGNGMVLIYRKNNAFKGGNPGTYLFENNQLLPGPQIHMGEFYSIEAPPGPMRVAFADIAGQSTGTTTALAAVSGGVLGVIADSIGRKRRGTDIVVYPDHTTYVTLYSGFSIGMREVTQQQGIAEIQGCRWINAPK